ncbi:hypothetical protein QTN25_010518 [Entamoeba marina]
MAVTAEPAVTGFFVSTIYKVEEKVGLLESRLTEIEDIERHVLNKLDQAAIDYKTAVKTSQKSQIAEVQKWLKSKVALLQNQKKQVFKGMKKLLIVLPAEQRLRILRRLKIEKRFDSVKEMIQDATTQSGFTQQQLDEYQKKQMKRAKTEKKRAEAREKLAKRRRKMPQKQILKKDMKKAAEQKKKTNQEINKAKEEVKKQVKATKKLTKQVEKLEKKSQKAKGKENVKLQKDVEKAKQELEKTKKLESNAKESVQKLKSKKYVDDVNAKKQIIQKLQGNIQETKGTCKKIIRKENGNSSK